MQGEKKEKNVFTKRKQATSNSHATKRQQQQPIVCIVSELRKRNN